MKKLNSGEFNKKFIFCGANILQNKKLRGIYLQNNDKMIQIGDQFKHKFSFTQEQVYIFAQVTGDTNPLHVDPVAGAQSVFGRNIIHGFLGGSVFTKIFGALWKADGHIYMKQTMQWLKPMFVDTEYEAVITVKEIFPENLSFSYTSAP